MFKIEILNISSSALAAEICAGPYNRLLRRQHCSSLCEQSEGHEHVANMASALGHNFVGFLAVFGRHNIRPPHFASKVSYSASPQTFTECSRSASCCAAAPERGSYSRIGACPYLLPQLINSRCCPCKGRISWAGLAPQHLSRYEPLTGARFINRLQEVGASPYPKYEPPSGALAPLYQS